MDDLGKELGISPATITAVAVPPSGYVDEFVRTPRLEPGKSFEFVTLYWVSSDGRVDDCRLLKTSGLKAFDKTFCATLAAKGRFKPALDSAGKPIRAPRFENVVIWTQAFRM